MAAPLTFTVLGEPIPKGSTKAFYVPKLKRAIVTHDNPRTRTWAQSVLEAAIAAYGNAAPLDGPVALTLRFYLPKPKSAPKRLVDQVKKPDLDKLVRALKDGLTRAGIYHDDSQVVATVASKYFAGRDLRPAARAGSAARGRDRGRVSAAGTADG